MQIVKINLDENKYVFNIHLKVPTISHVNPSDIAMKPA